MGLAATQLCGVLHGPARSRHAMMTRAMPFAGRDRVSVSRKRSRAGDRVGVTLLPLRCRNRLPGLGRARKPASVKRRAAPLSVTRKPLCTASGQLDTMDGPRAWLPERPS